MRVRRLYCVSPVLSLYFLRHGFIQTILASFRFIITRMSSSENIEGLLALLTEYVVTPLPPSTAGNFEGISAAAIAEETQVLAKRLTERQYSVLRSYYSLYIFPLKSETLPKAPKWDIKLLCRQMGKNETENLKANHKRIIKYFKTRYSVDKKLK